MCVLLCTEVKFLYCHHDVLVRTGTYQYVTVPVHMILPDLVPSGIVNSGTGSGYLVRTDNVTVRTGTYLVQTGTGNV